MSAPRKTLQEYLAWARLKPRTSEWSSALTINQAMCNKLLKQEHIKKVDESSNMLAVDGSDEDSETLWSWFIDYIFAAPRINFANDPDYESAELNLSMSLLSGKHITLDDNQGFPQVNRISVFDRLDHPQVEASRFSLIDVQGHVNKSGLVILDLGDPVAQGRIWEVSSRNTEHQRRMTGDFLKHEFAQAEHDRRAYILGELLDPIQDFLRPHRFITRTVMEEGADSREAQNYGAGAIEIRVAMDKEPMGGLPGPDWVYPLPSDRADFDVSVIMGSHFFTTKVIAKSVAKLFNDPLAEFNHELDGLGFTTRLRIKPSSGYLQIPAFAIVEGVTFNFSGFRIPAYFSDSEGIELSVSNNYHILRIGSASHLQRLVCTVNSVPYGINAYMKFGLDLRVSLDVESQRLKFSVYDVDFYPEFDFAGANLPQNLKDLLGSYRYKVALSELVDREIMKAFEEIESIDLDVFASLMFPHDSFRFTYKNLTPEVFLFGSIGRKSNTFGIEPLEPTLTHGQTINFKVMPALAGVTWRVVNLDGSTVGAGQMNPNSGAYTAPSLAEIDSPSKQIKIIATGPANERGERHVSMALAVVVPRAIALNPAIEIMSATRPDGEDETRTLSAHTTDGELRWSVIGTGSIDPLADADGKNEYRAPLQKPGFPSFTIDEVKVENQKTRQTQTSLMVIRHSPPPIVINHDYQGLPKNQVKLVAKMNGSEPTGGLVWECIPADAGSIDPVTRIFTASADSSSPYALIKVLFEIPAPVNKAFDGFTLVPLPVKPLPPRPTGRTKSVPLNASS
ncbi:TPA: hypothetical protein SAN82_001853 [Pseudomonas putida]|nr:hypothetical protein [Pseudomonas putida]